MPEFYAAPPGAHRLSVRGVALKVLLCGVRTLFTGEISLCIGNVKIPDQDITYLFLRSAGDADQLLRHRDKSRDVLRALPLICRNIIDFPGRSVIIPLVGIAKALRHIFDHIFQRASGMGQFNTEAGGIPECDPAAFQVIVLNGRMLIHPVMVVADKAVPEIAKTADGLQILLCRNEPSGMGVQRRGMVFHVRRLQSSLFRISGKIRPLSVYIKVRERQFPEPRQIRRDASDAIERILPKALHPDAPAEQCPRKRLNGHIADFAVQKQGLFQAVDIVHDLYGDWLEDAGSAQIRHQFQGSLNRLKRPGHVLLGTGKESLTVVVPLFL